jgi:hypothetical protein
MVSRGDSTCAQQQHGHGDPASPNLFFATSRTRAVDDCSKRDCGAEICFLFLLNFYYRRPWSTGVSLYLHGSEKHILNTTSPPHDALHGLYQYTSDLAFHPYMIP